MEKHLWANAKKAKWVLAGYFGAFAFMQLTVHLPNLKHREVFGYDGNGGRMLKIITNLTDEEMARLKFSRRMNWHWKGTRQLKDGNEMIADQELADRGIQWNQEEYIEYEKRPPHDKYL